MFVKLEGMIVNVSCLSHVYKSLDKSGRIFINFVYTNAKDSTEKSLASGPFETHELAEERLGWICATLNDTVDRHCSPRVTFRE